MDNLRILLVVADAVVARSLGRALEVLGGFTVRTQRDGTRATDAAREFIPDLILLDLVAEPWDGVQVASELAADPVLATIPIAFLTELVSADKLGERQTDTRGRRLIPKGLEPADLVDVVRELLVTRQY
jgi:two-component system OmpR family response regulator